MKTDRIRGYGLLLFMGELMVYALSAFLPVMRKKATIIRI